MRPGPLLSFAPVPRAKRSLARLAGALLAAAVLAGASLPPSATAQEPYDWLVRGGSVVDGTGSPARTTDLLLRGRVIAHVGPVDPDTLEVERTFDAGGLTVAPGFIDPHAHGDPVEAPGFGNFLAMGVTTIVLGQDGSSPEAGALSAHLDAVERAGPAVNVAYLVGHNTVRLESGVRFGAADGPGVRRMAELVEVALDAGALGLSTGLEYNPGRRADPPELAAVATPVAERGGVVMSHVRSEDRDEIEASVAELLEQGRRSGADVHVSHIKVVGGSDPGQARGILRRMAEARTAGVRATADLYPYRASFTGLSILFPEWALAPNDYATVVRERRDDLVAHLRDRVNSRNGPEAVLFGTGRRAGRTLAEVAEERDRPFEEILVELGPGGARAAYFVIDEAVLATFLADPHVAVSSDGSPTMAHPRGYGSFARVIRRYVVEEGLLSLEEAVRKMTSLPASILGLDDPGRVEVPAGTLREGWAADVVAFDPAGVADRATFEQPHLLAEGMRAVWVSGQPAWMDGRASDAGGAGRVIRAR